MHDFIYTKNFAWPRCDFIYTKNLQGAMWRKISIFKQRKWAYKGSKHSLGRCDVMTSWHHEIMTSWHHVIMSSCHHVIMSSCHHDIMTSWHHDIILSWHHDIMTSWHHDIMTSWHHAICQKFCYPAKPRSLFENRQFTSYRPPCYHEISLIASHFAYVFPLYSFTNWRAQRGKFLKIPLIFMVFPMKFFV